ncbi:MAG: N-acetyltransferase [Proteobacteria bacterium]|nr:N-acetyltransferase [Pseudomonadota bacterium]
MQIKVIKQLEQIAAEDWNRLLGTANPFLRHEFLLALEQSGCVTADKGWLPQHLALYDDHNTLLAAVPLYLKDHSWGEYIFDWAWANAYMRAGLDYYPKLTAAIPFTPAAGNRLLLHPDADAKTMSLQLGTAAIELAREHRASSLHWLFTTEDEKHLFSEQGLLPRRSFQFHWHNNDYKHFDDFLDEMSSRKRKKIRRERRYVTEANIELIRIPASEATDEHWKQFYQFYLRTIMLHGATPYLNERFFKQIGNTMPDAVHLLLAKHKDKTIAGALFLEGNDTLYGRYWGSDDDYHSLHFETCYYAPIEYCIERGLKCFEAGAQGRHKLARGFLPAETHSAHWLSEPQFNNAIADYLKYEGKGVEDEMSELEQHSPFRPKHENG